jgi:hypothetical protein
MALAGVLAVTVRMVDSSAAVRSKGHLKIAVRMILPEIKGLFFHHTLNLLFLNWSRTIFADLEVNDFL